MYVKEPKQRFRKITKETKAPNYRIWCFVGLLCLLVYAGISEFEKFTKIDTHGNFQISEKRLEKLHKDSIKFEKAQQYVLYAAQTGWYECFSCRDTTHIYLYAGEVWKYGYTINGAEIRYSQEMRKKFTYFAQFIGNVQQCMLEERKKLLLIHYCLKT